MPHKTAISLFDQMTTFILWQLIQVNSLKPYSMSSVNQSVGKQSCGFELLVSEDPAINYRPGLQPTEQTTRTKRRNLEWARYTRGASVLRWTDGQAGPTTQFQTISRRRAGGIVHHGCVDYNEFQPLASLLLATIPHPVWAVTPPWAATSKPSSMQWKISYLPTYLPSFQPKYLPRFLPTHLPTYQPRG